MQNLAVVIVTYNSADVICGCLTSLVQSGPTPKIFVVDNASTDDTCARIETWRTTNGDASARENVSLVRLPHNRGFAAGVNAGLELGLKDPNVDRVWILNPDTVVLPGTPQALANAPSGFSLLGHRILYAETPHRIQIDAGTISKWTGVTSNLGLGRARNHQAPKPEQMDFISGASMVASRAFVEAAGPMPEEYFLYYEEVDWALRRQNLPLSYCKDACILHHAGTAIGSPTLSSAPSAFSAFYKHRSRMMFLRRYFPTSLPLGYAYGLLKSLQYLMGGHSAQAKAVFCALLGKPIS